VSLWDKIKQRYIKTSTKYSTEYARDMSELDDISLWPTPIRPGQSVEVRYAGPLTGSGESVYLHYGVTSGNNWKNVYEVAMTEKAQGVYTAIIEVPSEPGDLAVCFRNSQGQWDNNDGNNWNYPVIPI
jgi:hypothetical protein